MVWILRRSENKSPGQSADQRPTEGMQLQMGCPSQQPGVQVQSRGSAECRALPPRTRLKRPKKLPFRRTCMWNELGAGTPASRSTCAALPPTPQPSLQRCGRLEVGGRGHNQARQQYEHRESLAGKEEQQSRGAEESGARTCSPKGSFMYARSPSLCGIREGTRGWRRRGSAGQALRSQALRSQALSPQALSPQALSPQVGLLRVQGLLGYQGCRVPRRCR
jgi:hypothetical protein